MLLGLLGSRSKTNTRRLYYVLRTSYYMYIQRLEWSLRCGLTGNVVVEWCLVSGEWCASRSHVFSSSKSCAARLKARGGGIK